MSNSLPLLSMDGSVGIMIWLQNRRPRSNGRGQSGFCSCTGSLQVWSLVKMSTGRYNARGMKLITHLRPVSRLRKRGGIPPFPHTPKLSTRTRLPVPSVCFLGLGTEEVEKRRRAIWCLLLNECVQTQQPHPAAYTPALKFSRKVATLPWICGTGTPTVPRFLCCPSVPPV